MTFTLAGVFAEAGAQWRRARGLLLPVVAVFHFLPMFAFWLFVGPMQAVENPEAQWDAASAWYLGNMPWLLGVQLIGWFGAAVVLLLLLDPARPSVGEALGRAAGLFPRFLSVAILTSIMVNVGLILLIVPGLYLFGRSFTWSAVVVAEPGHGATGSITRSFELTRGKGWILSLAGTIVVCAGLLAAEVLGPVRAVPGDVVHILLRTLLNAAAAAVSSATTLGLLLLQAAAYRLLAAPSKGI